MSSREALRFCIGLPDLKEESGERLALFVLLLTAKKCEQIDKGIHALVRYTCFNRRLRPRVRVR